MGNSVQFYTIGPLVEINLGFIQIPTYYFLISLTSCLAILWLYKRSEKRQLSQQMALDLSLILLGSGFIGARLTHIFFELPNYYFKEPLRMFYFWQGGFVFYGGALTAYVAGLIYLKKNNEPLGHWHDSLAPIIAFGYSMGRLACFCTGCCYGKICQLPWATSLKQVDMNNGFVTTVHRHPTQLYAFGLEFGIFLFLLWYEQAKGKRKTGQLFLIWLILHALNRINMELFRDDPRGPEVFGLSISMLISLLLLLLSFFFWLRKKKTT